MRNKMDPANQKPMSIRRRGMPTELFNELFASMPLQMAFVLLSIMPNGLLAKNVLKMIVNIKKETIAFAQFCRMPIPTLNLNSSKRTIAFYFEVHILNSDKPIYIGFCDHQFPLEDNYYLGWEDNSNSIGIRRKDILLIEGHMTNFGSIFEPYQRFFKKGDVIGLGMIQQPNSSLECFATCNAELLGKQSLPPKFTNIQLFPAIILADADDSIRANFGKDEWKFKNFRSATE